MTDSFRKHPLLQCAWFILPGITLLLSACGGGNAVESSSTFTASDTEIDVVSTTGIVHGEDISGSGNGRIRSRIQRFGSIVVNNDEYDTTNTVFNDDGNAFATQADLDVGKVITLDVVVNLPTQSAISADYRSNIKAPIDSIVLTNPDELEMTIIALGQTIKTNALANFKNTLPENFLPGDLIEVSGERDEMDTIVASFIQTVPSLANYKMIGKITTVTANSLTIGSLTVDFGAGTTLRDFPGAGPEVGQRIEVIADPADYSPLRLFASDVNFLPIAIAPVGVEMELEGFITRFASKFDFDISGIPVVASPDTVIVHANATEALGSSNALALGVKVEAEGKIRPDNVLDAVLIVIKHSGAVRVRGTVKEVEETVVSGILTTTLRTDLGVDFVITSETEVEDKSRIKDKNFTVADFNIGDRAEINAFLDFIPIEAASVERRKPRMKARLRGLITAENEAAGTIDVLKVLLTGDESITTFENEQGEEITQAQFHALVKVGSFVQVDWDKFDTTDVPPDHIEIK